MSSPEQPGQPGRPGRPGQRPEARATVEVAVPPLRAFEAFTAEIAAWWVPGPINFFDAGRTPTMHVEPGVGGRVLERYPDGELVIAEVTEWEPGTRVCWDGVVDDSRTVVTFERAGAGTRVAVHQYLRDGGERAFLFWPNVIGWLVPWCAQPANPTHARPSRRDTDRTGDSTMTAPDDVLRTARTVVLHDWPSQDVPDALVAAGLEVTYQAGPEPDDLYVTALVDGQAQTHRSGALPERADVVYSHRPLEEMPRLLAEARDLGAAVLWHQSGLDEDGSKNPTGVHLPEDEALERARLADEAGVELVTEPYIVEVAQQVAQQVRGG